MVVLDAPANGATVSGGFLVGGWAADTAAASGAGIEVRLRHRVAGIESVGALIAFGLCAFTTASVVLCSAVAPKRALGGSVPMTSERDRSSGSAMRR